MEYLSPDVQCIVWKMFHSKHVLEELNGLRKNVPINNHLPVSVKWGLKRTYHDLYSLEEVDVSCIPKITRNHKNDPWRSMLSNDI